MVPVTGEMERQIVTPEKRRLQRGVVVLGSEKRTSSYRKSLGMELWRLFPNQVRLPGRPSPTHYTEPRLRSTIRAQKFRCLGLRSVTEPTLLRVGDVDRIIRLKYSLQLLTWPSPSDSLW
jgi:hypothetical protein